MSIKTVNGVLLPDLTLKYLQVVEEGRLVRELKERLERGPLTPSYIVPDWDKNQNLDFVEESQFPNQDIKKADEPGQDKAYQGTC